MSVRRGDTVLVNKSLVIGAHMQRPNMVLVGNEWRFLFLFLDIPKQETTCWHSGKSCGGIWMGSYINYLCLYVHTQHEYLGLGSSSWLSSLVSSNR